MGMGMYEALQLVSMGNVEAFHFESMVVLETSGMGM